MEKDHPTEITDGVRLSTDFTKTNFGTPRECIVIMFGGADFNGEDQECLAEAAS
jgi:hypothetical protein